MYQCRHFNLIFFGIKVAKKYISVSKTVSNMSVVMRNASEHITMYMHWRLCIWNVIKSVRNKHPKNVFVLKNATFIPHPAQSTEGSHISRKLWTKFLFHWNIKICTEILLAYHFLFLFSVLSGSYSPTKRNKLKRVEFNWNIERIISKGFGARASGDG